MADKSSKSPRLSASKRLSWMSKYSSSNDTSSTSLVSSSPTSASAQQRNPQSPTEPSSLYRTSSPRVSSASLSRQELDQEASHIIRTALERTSSRASNSTAEPPSGRSTGSFSRMSFSSMMGGLSALSLRGSHDEKDKEKEKDKERGRSRTALKLRSRSSSASARANTLADEAAQRTRSTSPFHRRIFTRDPSPSVEALKLSQSDVESDSELATPRGVIRPRNAFSAGSEDESGSEDDGDEESEESWSGEDPDKFDEITMENTSHNALVAPMVAEPDNLEAPDPLGEGVNIVVPPEPYFPTTLNASRRNPRRRKSTKHELLSLKTSRPIFQRDRCTITLTHGDPEHALEVNGRRPRRYVVASDLSEESRYAVEWGIGTVLRDGDEMLLVSVREEESKVDPPNLSTIDRVVKIRNQQERQTLAYILVRQVTSLLQRTQLHVTVSCQAWHAKNSRHMLLDIIDHAEPSMLIVGSRGLGEIKGIILGSTSHYLVQKCSVPVMVARRRLKRPPRRSAHLSPHRARVSLAEAAGVERVTPRVDQDVENMRSELQRDDNDREHDLHGLEEGERDGDDDDEAIHALGTKVRGD